MATSDKRKRGRPPSGKKGFCIRMRPETHHDLTLAAKLAGYTNIGDWLDTKALTVSPQKGRQDSRQSIPGTRYPVFVTYCTQAREALEKMRDVVDCKPKRILADANAKKALQAVRDEYRRLLSLVRNVGLDAATTPEKKTR